MSMQSWQAWSNNAHKSWWKDAGLRLCMLNIVILYGSVFTDGYDSGIINASQALPAWEMYFHQPAGSLLGAIVSAYAFPQLLFPLPAAWLSDRLGRKFVIRLGAICGIVGPIVSAFAKNIATYIGGRVITGTATAVFQVTIATLISEIAHPRFRSYVTGTLRATYFVGSITSAWVGFGFVGTLSSWGWRVPTILQLSGAAPILIWSCTPWMAESPRYFVKKGNQHRAHAILAKFHANGDLQDELVVNELQEILVAVELDDQAAKSSYMDFWRTKGNRKRLGLICWVVWGSCLAGNNLASYYIVPILLAAGIKSYSALLGIVAGINGALLFTTLGGAQSFERIGRRPTTLISTSGTIFFFIILTGLSGSYTTTLHTPTGIAVVPILAFLFISYVFAWTPIAYIYLPEILPYQLRAKGMAVFSVLQAGGQVFGAYVNAIALEAIGWKYYILYIFSNIGILIVGWLFMVETKGLTLEEIAIRFDGETSAIAMEVHKEDRVVESGEKTTEVLDENQALPASLV